MKYENWILVYLYVCLRYQMLSEAMFGMDVSMGHENISINGEGNEIQLTYKDAIISRFRHLFILSVDSMWQLTLYQPARSQKRLSLSVRSLKKLSSSS